MTESWTWVRRALALAVMGLAAAAAQAQPALWEVEGRSNRVFLFGSVHLIPWVGEFIDAIGFWFALLLGLGLALGLVGIISWPMMPASISSEGLEGWDAVSRAYNYLYQAPWHFLWNGFVAVIYGAVLVFFFGFVASLAVYLAAC